MIKNLNFIQTPYEYDCGRLHLLIKANTETKTIHILDFFSPTSILNCIEVMQPQILAQLNFEEEPIEWNWIWYASSGKPLMIPAGADCSDELINASHEVVDSDMIAQLTKLSEMGVWQLQ